MITALLIGAGALWMIKHHKSVSGIGKVERIKRRIYKEVSLAQDAGVDFSKKFPELSRAEMDALEHIGKNVIGWKQSKRSIESGKPYVESYYGSLRRAWNAVSGVQGIGRAYDVRNADGDVVLTWNDVKEHIQQEPDAHTMLALPPHIEKKAPKAKKPSKAEQKEAKLRERYNWAWDFLKAIAIDGDCSYPVNFQSVTQEVLGKKVPEEAGGDGKATAADMIAWAWANKKFKINKSRAVVTYLNKYNGKEYPANTWSYGEIFDILNKCWQMRKNDQGWRDNADRLDDIRIALLDKAQHMHVTIPEEYQSEYHDLYLRGDDRYEHLDWINWILWTHQHYDVGGDTYYPYCSYDTKEEALRSHGGKMQGSGWKIMPVWDVPIEKITGVSGIGGERFDARYVSDRSGNWYVMLDESFLPEMIRRGASEYDITVAQNQLDSCGRIIVFIEDWLQTLDNEYYLEEVYYIIDKMREHGDL